MSEGSGLMVRVRLGVQHLWLRVRGRTSEHEPLSPDAKHVCSEGHELDEGAGCRGKVMVIVRAIAIFIIMAALTEFYNRRHFPSIFPTKALAGTPRDPKP